MRAACTAFLLLLSVSVACSRPAGSGGRVGSGGGGPCADAPALSPSTLTFQSHVGYRQIRQAEILNCGRAARIVTLRITPPFRLRTPQVLAGFGSTSIDVQFYPTREGVVEGELTLTVPDTSITSTIALLGQAERPPHCSAPTPCDFAARDPVTGECTVGPLPEGARCDSGNDCQVQERCVAHECVGTPVDCNDGNVCTDDSCNPLLGKCVHLDVTCPGTDPGEACKVPRCNPVTGCYVANAPERTPCGEFSCELAQWCDNDGVCQTAVPPEHYPCDRECGEGWCEGARCERSDGGPRELSDGQVVFESASPFYFPGVTDDEGASYFFTGIPGNYALVSVSAEGFLRYEADRPLPHGDTFPRMLRWGDRLFESVGTAVDLRRTDDGKTDWVRFIVTNEGPPLQSVAVAVVARSGDRLITAAHEVPDPEIACADGPNDRVVHIYGLDLLGEIAWERMFPGRLQQHLSPRDESAEQGLVVDEAGTIWFTIGRCGYQDELVGLDVDGKDVQRVRLQGCLGCETLAASGGVVATAGGLLVRPADPDPLHPLDLPGTFAPRLGSRVGYVLGEHAVYGVDLQDEAVLWNHEMPVEGTSLRDAVLVVSSDKNKPGTSLLTFDVRPHDGGTSIWLTELLADGTPQRACNLGGIPGVPPDDFVLEGTPVIGTDELLVLGHDLGIDRLQLRRYRLPKLRLAGAGWVSAGGNNSRDGSAR